MKILVIALAIAYVLFPLDFVPDVIPVVGWADDLLAAVIGLRAMLTSSK